MSLLRIKMGAAIEEDLFGSRTTSFCLSSTWRQLTRDGHSWIVYSMHEVDWRYLFVVVMVMVVLVVVVGHKASPASTAV